MTTCKCRENDKDNLVITRSYLQDLGNYQARLSRKDAIDEIIALIQTHQNLWFSQSLQAQILNSGKDAFWSNKSATAQALITEIRNIA